MNPDQFRLLSVCLCLSLSSGITIKSASHLLQGEPGGKMFCILSLMPQKLNALITSDLRWSALVTVPLHIFDLIHMHPMNARGHQEGGQMMLRLPYVFFFFFVGGLYSRTETLQSEVHVPTRTIHTVKDARLRPANQISRATV